MYNPNIGRECGIEKCVMLILKKRKRQMTVTKGLLKRLEDLEVGGREETIQTTALLRTARIPKRGLENWGDMLSLKLQCKTITDVKNTQGVNKNNVQSKYREGMWHRKMCHANIEKRKTTNDGKNITTKSRKSQNDRKKEKSQILGNIGSGHHQTSGRWKKKVKRIPHENEKTTRNQTML